MENLTADLSAEERRVSHLVPYHVIQQVHPRYYRTQRVPR